MNTKPNPKDDRFLSRRQVLDRYGVTSMCLYRWEKKKSLGFPKPIRLGETQQARRFYLLSDLLEWERKMAKHGARAFDAQPVSRDGKPHGRPRKEHAHA